MLIISEQAQRVIRQIPRQPFLPRTAGLRIAVGGPQGDTLQVGEAAEPKRGDDILDYGGARVFLEPAAGSRLDNGYLDVHHTPDGRLEFLYAAREQSHHSS